MAARVMLLKHEMVAQIDHCLKMKFVGWERGRVADEIKKWMSKQLNQVSSTLLTQNQSLKTLIGQVGSPLHPPGGSGEPIAPPGGSGSEKF